MPTTVYQCDLCQIVYPTLQEALDCEAGGVPEYPDWIQPGTLVWAFGEQGVVGPGRIDTLLIENDGLQHRMAVWVDIPGYDVSHNYVTDEPLPQWAVNPMIGWSFLRYVDLDGIPEQARLWAFACNALGIEPDPTKAEWFEPKRLTHQAFAEALGSVEGASG